MMRVHRATLLTVWIWAVGILFLGPGTLHAANLRLEFAPPEGPGALGVHDYLQRSKLLNDLSLAVTMRIDLPVPVTIRVGSKGPYYDPETKTISIPYSLGLLQGIGLDRLEPSKRDRLYEGAATFVVCHELGHALIDLFRLHSEDGSEEELADALAVYLSVSVFGRGQTVFEALSSLRGEGAQQSTQQSQGGGLSPARRESLICHVEGAQGEPKAAIESATARERRRECSETFARLRAQIDRLLEAHLKPH